MDETMPDHLIFALKPFPTLAARTSRDRAVMRSRGRVYVCVGIKQVLGLERWCFAASDMASIDSLVSNPVNAHTVYCGRRSRWRRNILFGAGNFTARAAAVVDARPMWE